MDGILRVRSTVVPHGYRRCAVEGRIRVTFVAAAVPGREERNGFSSRLHDLLLAVLAVADVDLFVPITSESDSPEAIRYWRGVKGLTLHLTLDTRPRSPVLHRITRAGHHVFGRLPRWSVPRRAPELEQHLQSGNAEVLCLHLPVTAHLADLAPARLPVVALLEEGLERGVLAPRERSWLHTVAGRTEARRVRQLYKSTSRRAEVVVAISVQERHLLGEAGVDAERIVVVPRGIDVTYFKPEAVSAEPVFDVAVFGDFRFARNLAPARDALLWSAFQQTGLRWAFVGDIAPNDADSLTAAGATVIGAVDDLRPFYADTKVVLVPAVAVTGVKTTLVQGWAMEKAVVSTPQSAVGLPAVEGENVLLGSTTPELVERCAQLSTSETRREHLAAAGRRTVCEELDAGKIAADFAELVISVARVS